MFHEGDYDKPEFSVPINGMNQFVSPDSLPSNFCYSLENIIPSPLGEGKVRYGTDLIYTLNNPEYNIIRAFPFTLNGSIYQGLMYIGYYLQDGALSNVIVADSANLIFNSNTPNYYLQDTKIKIGYTFNGVVYTLYSDIKNISIVAGNTVNITLDNNLLPDPNSGTLAVNDIWAQRAKIYAYNLTTNTLSAQLKDNLEVACIPRCTFYQQKMIICNGVNNMMDWDGTQLNDVSEYVVELGSNTFTKIDNNNFSFNSFGIFDTTKYFVGNSIILKVNGQETTALIQNKTTVVNLITLTVDKVIPNFGANDQVVLYYQDKPPTFSYIYVTKDRVWALGPGRAGLEFRDTNQQLKVYYNYRINSSFGYGFFNENNKTVPYIDMSEKTKISDNFEAITQVNGLMAFIGRSHTQIWSGYTPGLGGDFSWNSTLSEGIFHGDLLLELSNDSYFVSENGIKSFGTLNIAKQFSASPDEAVDPIVKKFILDAKSSNLNYRKCLSFKYESGGFSGFKISDNKIISSLFSTKLYSWFYLSGDFKSANCFQQIGKLFYIFIGNKIYKYADGNDGSQKIYADQGGQSFIPISWIPGLINFKGRKGFANKRYELILDYPSSFIINDQNIIQISIFGDVPRSFSLTDQCTFQYRGDLFGQEPLSKQVSNTQPGFRLRKDYEVVNKRLKFESSSFWISISGYVMNGPITFRRIRLFGVGER